MAETDTLSETADPPRHRFRPLHLDRGAGAASRTYTGEQADVAEGERAQW